MKPLLLAVALTTLACASTTPTSPKPLASTPQLATGFTADAATGDVVHATSGFRFAPTHNGCARGEIHAYDGSGENVSVAYDCPSGVWLTFYVYPNSFGETPNPPDHFRMIVGDVLSAHDGTQIEKAVEMPLPLGARTLPGYNAFLHWAEAGGEVGSMAMLIPDGARFVKVRVSFPLDGSDLPIEEAWQLSEAVLRSVAPAE